jgi:hypothetical protein
MSFRCSWKYPAWAGGWSSEIRRRLRAGPDSVGDVGRKQGDDLLGEGYGAEVG